MSGYLKRSLVRIGAVAVQNNPLYTERELAYQLDDSDSKVIVTFTLLVPRIEKIKSQTKLEKIIACNLCGGDPKCVTYCETKSIEFIERDSVAMQKKKESLQELEQHLKLAEADFESY